MYISGEKLRFSFRRTAKYAFIPMLAFHPELHYPEKILAHKMELRELRYVL